MGHFLQYLAQLVRVLDGLAGHPGIDAALVQLVRADDLHVHLHLPERLLERREEVLGVRDVAAFGVGYVREAVADVPLVALRDTGGDLAQRVYGVGVENETDLFAARPQDVRHGLGNEDLAQVTGVDVPGDAYAAHDHVRPRPEGIGDPLSPKGYGKAGRSTGLAHAMLRSGDLAGRFDVDDLVLRRAAGGRDGDLLPNLLLQDGLAHRGGVAELTARR